jgi:hypothetical protein
MEHPETILRRTVKKNMSGTWEMTWHEDRQVSPGTPDISYVMIHAHCETGWLELKAIAGLTPAPWRFKLEPSQPEWMQRHADRVPVHFLVAVRETCWLIHGREWRMLQLPVSELMLDTVCIIKFEFSDMRRVLAPVLIDLTYRLR